MPDLVAFGPEPSQRWQHSFSDNEIVRLGRSPRKGWKVPWDRAISREHADLVLNDDQLAVRCLGTARNPIYFNEECTTAEFKLSIGQEFRIGETTFQLVPGDAGSTTFSLLQEFSYRQEDLAEFEFGNDREQLQALSNLPQLILESKTDESFATKLCGLLIQTIPNADVAAVIEYEDVSAIGMSQPMMLRWSSRTTTLDSFRPSRSLIRTSLQSRESLLYIWPSAGTDPGLVTRLSGSAGAGEEQDPVTVDRPDWAFCTPFGSEARPGCWCIYVAGRREPGLTTISEDGLKGDLRFTQLLAEFVASIREVRELQQEKNKINQFFSPAVVETMSNTSNIDSVLVPKEQNISVLFCDVRGFSRRAEKARYELLDLLNRVSDALGVMTEAIMRYEGVIADFQGDAALAFWGWPDQLEDGPISACRAALAMHSRFKNVNQEKGSSLQGFQVGIGIGYGRAVAGKIGTYVQCKIGVFGPVVNLASRLEGMTKQFRAPILVDEPTAEFVERHLPETEARVRRLGRVRPKGMETPLMVCELLPPEGEASDISNQLIAEHEKAVSNFITGNWSEAIDLFERTPAGNQAKELILIFMAQNNYTPPDDWDGIINLEHKD